VKALKDELEELLTRERRPFKNGERIQEYIAKDRLPGTKPPPNAPGATRHAKERGRRSQQRSSRKANREGAKNRRRQSGTKPSDHELKRRRKESKREAGRIMDRLKRPLEWIDYVEPALRATEGILDAVHGDREDAKKEFREAVE